MVMLGALVGSGTTGLEPDSVKEVISTSTKKAYLDSNIAAFDAGFTHVQG
jgi:indolepyruvate ferredoxin oxidoreductase beta subunit